MLRRLRSISPILMLTAAAVVGCEGPTDDGNEGEGEGEGEAPLCTGTQTLPSLTANNNNGLNVLDGRCTTITGRLTLTGPPGVSDAAPVRVVVQIGNDLIIDSGARLTDTDDFLGLTIIDDELRIEDNSTITSLRLVVLEGIGRLTIKNNAALERIELPALRSIAGDVSSDTIVIEDNASLRVIDAPVLTRVSVDITVDNNTSLCADVMDDLVAGLTRYGGRYRQTNSVGSCN